MMDVPGAAGLRAGTREAAYPPAASTPSADERARVAERGQPIGRWLRDLESAVEGCFTRYGTLIEKHRHTPYSDAALCRGSPSMLPGPRATGDPSLRGRLQERRDLIGTLLGRTVNCNDRHLEPPGTVRRTPSRPAGDVPIQRRGSICLWHDCRKRRYALRADGRSSGAA